MLIMGMTSIFSPIIWQSYEISAKVNIFIFQQLDFHFS